MTRDQYYPDKSPGFHINNKNESGRCGAGRTYLCPFSGNSGSENHYETREEADTESERRLAEKHGSFNPVKKHTTNDIPSNSLTDEDMDEIENSVATGKHNVEDNSDYMPSNRLTDEDMDEMEYYFLNKKDPQEDENKTSSLYDDQLPF